MDANHLVSATLTALPALCTTILLPGSGAMTLGFDGIASPVTAPATFHVPCPTAVIIPRADTSLGLATTGDSSLTQHESSESGSKADNFRDPFYATTFPIAYALAATTVTAYMLVIMLFVTPRSFLDGGIVYLGRRAGFTNSASGVSIGGRPWLQKVAALTVAVSLTIATADTFKAAQNQYAWGYQNAQLLQDEVMNSVELKVIRLVSDTFLWLAQAQTLIRLFPRQREKIIIKWVAFALITLDVVFSAITSFQYSENGINTTVRPQKFVHPVPALSYLFQLSLGVLYAGWVFYYALMKRRYAFYHPFMKNITLVAIISITSIVIPIVFFILDISQPQFTGWGDYVRWVGAAAASVVVWEWVERIEALEREEKKDGILGREVFDGDDVLEINASEFPWLRNRKNRKGGGPGSGNGGDQQQTLTTATNGWPHVSGLRDRYRGQGSEGEPEMTTAGPSTQRGMGILRPPIWPARPAPAVTPISRADTASAASTVYAVRYQPPSEATTRTPDPLPQQSMVDLSRQNSSSQSRETNDEPNPPNQAPASVQRGHSTSPAVDQPLDLEANTIVSPTQGGWRNLTFSNPLSRLDSEDATNDAPVQPQSPPPEQSRNGRGAQPSRWDLRGRLEDFAANQAEKMRGRVRTAPNTESLPVTVIPAPARRGAALQQVLEEEELNTAEQSMARELLANDSSTNSHSNTSRDASGEIGQLERSRSTFSGSRYDNQQGDLPIPPNNPPLWRGVQSRVVYDGDYYSDDDDSSLSDRPSLDHRRQDSESWVAARAP